MGKFKFGKKSIKHIQTVDEILQELAARTIEVSEIDITVLKSGGLRTAEEQNEIFKAGNSKCDGYEKKSYHQSGKAIDLVPYVDGKPTWTDKTAFIKIKQAVDKAWNDTMHHKDIYLHWGGYWGAEDLDGDGVLEVDEKLGWDCAHYELRSYPQIKGVHPVDIKH